MSSYEEYTNPCLSFHCWNSDRGASAFITNSPRARRTSDATANFPIAISPISM